MNEKALFTKSDWPVCSASLPVTYPCSLLWVKLWNSSKPKEPNAFPPDSFVPPCFTLQALLQAKENAPCSSAAYLLSATCWYRQPCSHLLSCGTHKCLWPMVWSPVCCTQHQTHTAQRTENTHPGKEWVLEFNEMTGQTKLAGLMAWPDKCTDQQAVHRQLAPYILLHNLRLLLPASPNEFHPQDRESPNQSVQDP